ncbi:hypothetical protein GU243_08225 [Pseudarthrobacter psychrotolerans]|uniref:Preprotein translocase subunit SecB n=1 Tax=Pseudarthrobacter psychrotolerans TaxID=2697569 RepID=A0A6P1NMG1_9MICC|nr:protein-export chaperone SecB [Pseudarthrobacter psychrotolerans]QHK19714.1 hypothetical protein GU243_08225 [Pseudarthrobacter psychrotolerans]
MSTTNSQESIIEVQAIVLEGIKFERGFAFETGDDGQASLGMNLEQPTETQNFRSTRCTVELKDANENVIVSIETKFRSEFDIRGDGDAKGIDSYLSSLAMRVTYPYHRQLIATLTAQSGLPGMTIPLISDAQLEAIAKESKESSAMQG